MPNSWFQMIMLIPGLANLSIFVGTDVTKFLQLIKNLFKHYQVVTFKNKLEHFLGYCQLAISL